MSQALDLDERLTAAIEGLAGASSAVVELLRELRYRNQVTGLPNKAQFDLDLRRWPADQPCAVLAMDIDGLKSMNQQFGHDGADDLIRGVALLLEAYAADHDGFCVYHRSGDEFAGLLNADEASADWFAGDLWEHLDRARHQVPSTGGAEVAVPVSVAVACAADRSRPEAAVDTSDRLAEFAKLPSVRASLGRGAVSLATLRKAGLEARFADSAAAEWPRERIECPECHSHGHLSVSPGGRGCPEHGRLAPAGQA